MIDLYYWTTPNGHKITLFLEEAGLEYRVLPVNIGKGEQFAPAFLRIAPNNRMPAIVDHAPQDGGEPLSLFESGAILLYLAEKTGRFVPEDTRGRAEVLQWLFWQMGGLGPMAGQNHHFRNYAPEKIPYAIDRYVNETNRLYGVLDRRLADRSFVAGPEYTIADMASYPLDPARGAGPVDRRVSPPQALARRDQGPAGHRARLRPGADGQPPGWRHQDGGGTPGAVRADRDVASAARLTAAGRPPRVMPARVAARPHPAKEAVMPTSRTRRPIAPPADPAAMPTPPQRRGARTARSRIVQRVLVALMAGLALLALQRFGLLDRLSGGALSNLDWSSDYPLVEHLRRQVVRDGLTHDSPDCLLFVINGNDPPDASRMDVMEKHSGSCPGTRGQLPRLFTLKVNRVAHSVGSDAGSPGSFHPLP